MEDVHDRKHANNLESYYDASIRLIRDADSIQLFGPGEAKVEFAKRLQSKKPSRRMISIETTDKLTDPQIVAKVRQYFS